MGIKFMHLSTNTNVKSNKPSLLVAISLLWLCVVMAITRFVKITFEPNQIVDIILFFVLFPLLSILSFSILEYRNNVTTYLGLYREADKTRKKIKQLMIKILGALGFAGITVYGFYLFLGIATYLTAKIEFIRPATVIRVLCSTNGYALNIYVPLKTWNYETINIPFSTCESYPNSLKIAGYEIELHGRKNSLGRIYDGFNYKVNTYNK